MDTAFALRGVKKRFKGFDLGPLDLDVTTGSVVGFVGPNGSGKTTTLRCMGGVLLPDAGSIEILGHDAAPDAQDWRQELAFVSDEAAFYESWTGQKNLDFIRQFFHGWSAERASELAARFACPLEQKVKTLSKGNRVKLSLIAALARSPRLLLLDEPTAGLDPVVRSEVLDVLWELLETGDRTIFYSTHILGDIERLADELVFLHEGQIVQRSPKDELIAEWGQISFLLEGKLPEMAGIVELTSAGSQHRLISRTRQQTLAHLQAAGAQNIQQSPMPIDEVAVFILKGRAMWYIVRAEWGNNWKMLGAMFVMFHLIISGNILLFDSHAFGGLTGASVPMLAMATLFPATIGPSALFQVEGNERRLQLWADLPLSRTELGLAYGMVLLTPWPLAVASFVGLSLWWPGASATVFAWSGLVLAFLAVTWLMAMVFGRKVAHIAMYALYIIASFVAETALLLLSSTFGWGLAEADDYQFGSMWQVFQQPEAGVLLYLLAAAMMLLSLLLFRRSELIQER